MTIDICIRPSLHAYYLKLQNLNTILLIFLIMNWIIFDDPTPYLYILLFMCNLSILLVRKQILKQVLFAFAVFWPLLIFHSIFTITVIVPFHILFKNFFKPSSPYLSPNFFNSRLAFFIKNRSQMPKVPFFIQSIKRSLPFRSSTFLFFQSSTEHLSVQTPIWRSSFCRCSTSHVCLH